MARVRPSDRIDQLIEAAVAVFTERGYRRTQMADVARALGVAPGTLYLYVSSKEALFDLVIRRAFVDGTPETIEAFPLPTPSPGATLAHLRERMESEATLPTLRASLRRRSAGDARAELTAILRELYALVARWRRGIRMLDRSALDWPELATLYATDVRQRMIGDLGDYLRRGGRNGRLRPLVHPEIAARLLIESVAWFAMHRHGDPQPPAVTDEDAIETIIAVALDGLLER